jgi:hypothetical protein
MDNYSISELIYYYSHPDEAEVIERVENKQLDIEYDLSPLIDMALATGDKEWFMELTAAGDKSWNI